MDRYCFSIQDGKKVCYPKVASSVTEVPVINLQLYYVPIHRQQIKERTECLNTTLRDKNKTVQPKSDEAENCPLQHK